MSEVAITTLRARRVGIFLAIMAIAGLLLVYPPLRLTSLLVPGWTPQAWQILALFFLPMVVRLVHRRGDAVWRRALTSAIFNWVGVCFMTLSLLIPAELILLTRLVEPQLVGQALLSLLIVICLYAVYNALRLHVYTVELEGPTHMSGRRLAQISDVHIGSRQPGFLRPIVAKVNDLQPDYVLITGDLIDMEGIPEDQLAPLRELQAPAIYCIGNHERYVDCESICKRLTNLGITVLRNAVLQTNDVQFIGIDDAERRDQVALQLASITPAQDTYRILLYHRPDGAADAAAWGVDLMLTGHTHRGQIFPFTLLVKRTFPELYRLYRHGDMHLYVSPGTGTWGPVMRLGSKCEITQFRLV